jgi:hypothetical protein
VIQAAKEALERKFLRGLLPVKAIRESAQLLETRDLLPQNPLSLPGRNLEDTSEEPVEIEEPSQAVRSVVVVNVKESS